MRRQVLVSVLAVGASLAAWCGTASAHDYGYNECCSDYGYYGHYRRHGGTAPQTHDRYNNEHRDSYYAPPPPVYGYYTCCTSYDYSYVRRPRYYHHSDNYHSDHYRYRRHRADYRYRRWHRDDYDD